MPKTILITGATSGFGEACARKFALDGQTLILVGRRSHRLEKLQKELQAAVKTHIVCLDVRSREHVEKKLGNLPDGFTEIDVLINNAGLALGLKPAHDINMDDWETMVDTNIKGVVYCTRTVLPSMVRRNRGHIVNLGSVAGDWPYPGGNVYGSTKAFVKQFSRNLRADLLGKNIRVTNIEPGMAETEFSEVRFKGDKEKAAEVYEGVEPLTANDIAHIIHWAVNLPVHVNINRIEVMPTHQAWGPLAVSRQKLEKD